MPDLPLDTLFIVGLLLASFVGKILEGRSKKTKEEKKPQKAPPEKHTSRDRTPEGKGLGELLREAFGEVVEPVHEESRSSYQEPITEEAAPAVFQPSKPKSTPVHSSFPQKDNRETYQTTRKWLRVGGLASKKSLRRAFVVKEILDQPVGLRKTLF